MPKDHLADLRKALARPIRVNAPARFHAIVRTDPCTADWMRRNSIDKVRLADVAFNQLLMYLAIGIVGGIVLFMVLPQPMGPFLLLCFLVLPLISASSLLQTPARLAAEEQRAMLAESPTVVGMISMSMHLSPSLERAVDYAARSGNDALTLRLRDILWDSATGWSGSVSDGVERLSASLGETNRNLCQALHMISTAAAEHTRIGLERLLDRANELAVGGVKERLDRYVTSLSFPTMVLFAFGVLLPVMLFSMVPLLTIRVALGSETASSAAIGTPQIAFLMLVLFPACAFLYAQATLRKHPLRRIVPLTLPKNDLMTIAILIGTGAVVGAFLPFGQPYAALVLMVLPLSVWCVRRYGKEHAQSKALPARDEEFSSALYQIGNQLLSGSSMESALMAAAQVRKGTSFCMFASEIMHQLRASGIPLAQAMAKNEELARATPLVRNAFITVAEAAEIDPEASGRTAVNLAKYIWELRESERVGRERMRSVVDMMTYTTMLFAPIVLAVTGGLYQVVSSITPMGDSGALVWIGGIYVVELSLVICYFNQNLMGQGGAKDLLYGLGRTAPVAMLSFVIASVIAQEGLSSIF